MTDVTGRLQMAINGTLGDRFFIAAGLHKPHLPFYAPAEFYELYPNPPEPKPLMVPKDMPYYAWHSCLSRSSNPDDYSDWGNFTDIPNEMSLHEPMPPDASARLRRGYAASVSYTDSNIGKILLAAEPVKDSTIVVLIGDHGWSLGEGNVWCKMTNFENGVRTPLIFRAPGLQPAGKEVHRTAHLAETVDLYRTLADAVGLLSKVEDSVDGVSLLPLLKDPAMRTGAIPPPRTSAISQFPRCYSVLPPTVCTILIYQSLACISLLHDVRYDRRCLAGRTRPARTVTLRTSRRWIARTARMSAVISLTSWATACAQPSIALPSGVTGTV